MEETTMAGLAVGIGVDLVEEHGARIPRWAGAGLVAVLGSIGGVAFLDTERSMATQDVRLRLCAAFGMVGVAALLVFMAGLRAYLGAQVPAHSLTGRVAGMAGQVTAAVLLVSYLTKLIVAENLHHITGAADLVVRNALDELSTGAWATMAVAMLAVAIAAIRHGGLPRWLGLVSAVLGVLVVAATLAGVPPAAYLPTMAWLLVTSGVLLRSCHA
jgi:hypothetical protein